MRSLAPALFCLAFMAGCTSKDKTPPEAQVVVEQKASVFCEAPHYMPVAGQACVVHGSMRRMDASEIGLTAKEFGPTGFVTVRFVGMSVITTILSSANAQDRALEAMNGKFASAGFKGCHVPVSVEAEDDDDFVAGSGPIGKPVFLEGSVDGVVLVDVSLVCTDQVRDLSLTEVEIELDRIGREVEAVSAEAIRVASLPLPLTGIPEIDDVEPFVPTTLDDILVEGPVTYAVVPDPFAAQEPKLKLVIRGVGLDANGEPVVLEIIEEPGYEHCNRLPHESSEAKKCFDGPPRR